VKASHAKQNILSKIKQALNKPVPVPFPQSEGNSSVFKPLEQDADIAFAENFSNLQGRFSYCVTENELAVQLLALFTARKWQKIYCTETAIQQTLTQAGLALQYTSSLADCDAAITGCEYLIARTGSIVMSSKQQSGRTTSVYAPVHICVAYTSQLVPDIKDALGGIGSKYNKLPSLITLATGPSRTADIEKTLVVGIHGPKEVFCFLVEG
jgi:L-lactate dehydrogenase complex protein LldG